MKFSLRDPWIAAGLLIFVSAPVHAFSLLTNSDFNTDVSGWTATGPWVHNSAVGVFGQLGAAQITSPAAGEYFLSQCADISDVDPGRSVTLAAFVNTVDHNSPVAVEVELHDTADCSGAPLATAGEANASPPTNFFLGLYTPIAVPLTGAQRALVRLKVTSTAAAQTTLFDIATLRYDLVVGGEFGSDLNNWVQTPPGSWQIVSDGVSTPPGAAEATVSAGGFVFLSQCLLVGALPATATYQAWIRVKALDELADYQLSFQFWDNETCAPPGNQVLVQGLLTRPGTLNQWGFFFTTVPRPEEARSVAIFIALNAGQGTPGSRFRVDDFIMTPAGALLNTGDGNFKDGFEPAGTNNP